MIETKPASGRIIRCPRCRKSTRYDPTNPFRPFCSALCKNEDIIDWAEEKFAVPGAIIETDDPLIGLATEPSDD